ncbi:glycosyltransferase family 4 protein [Mucilaginibacter flavus]|uniref:glycosyltransferase family 4 protein n=1 Tax=Mucilaginibacter flavus TaxID=931504 RepID=UPI0025B53BB8|nr:glycosyltransferase family 1 protein [Mucilaginibacter flavus]MDN3583918.1 glycosyltransferase family 1 protein [Mucilaginibacter flavus]
MKPSILITFDSLKRATSGLFFFERSLGEELLKQGNNQFNIWGYLHPKAIYSFEKLKNGITKLLLHKAFFPAYNKFGLVHFTNQYCKLNPRRVNGKKILTIHDMNPVHEKNRSPRRYKKYINRLGGYIAACDRIVTISEFVAGDVKQYYPEAAGKITVIYNGADKLMVPQGHEPAHKPARKFLFTIGSMSAKKNFHVLPALLEGNDYELVITGKITGYQEKILEEAAKYNCTNRVVFTNLVSDDDKAWYYQNCEAFLFPSIAEGFGLPVIEAMHFGKPVFLSTHTSLPEIGGDVAWYFDNFEPATMQATFLKGMAAYQADDTLKADIIARASKFDWAKTAEQYLNLYAECLSV